jgi:hypothetical protein
VVGSDGKIVEGAILEILDQSGTVQRAIKTNQLGHFMIVTPLANGKYEIKTEKEDFNFDPITFNAEGKIIPPIAIWANEQSKKDVSNTKSKNDEKTVYEQGKTKEKTQ